MVGDVDDALSSVDTRSTIGIESSMFRKRSLIKWTIQLASWNDLGYIYSHFSDHENAMKCRVYLYQALFVDPYTSLRLTYGYSYSLFCLFVVGSEVRRREVRPLRF